MENNNKYLFYNNLRINVYLPFTLNNMSGKC